MFNFITELFSKKKQQTQEIESFFGCMYDKLKSMREQLDQLSSEEQISFKKNSTIQEISREIDSLEKYLNTTKIYIVFMGTISAGKSTFINSLLGQQLLPSRNQECTQQILMISYNEKIIVNNREMDLNNAQEFLQELQKDAKFEVANISTPSQFHLNLPSDLRKRVIFVDTPGIKGFDQQKMNLIEHFQQIDQQIGVHHRINVWISNYTTFDSDKQLQSLILDTSHKLQIENSKSNKTNSFLYYADEISQQSFIQAQSQYNENIQQQTQQPLLFYVLNKYDERKQSEDLNIQTVINDINKSIGQDNIIFKISAIRALRYQIMNYGSQEAINKFIQNYFIDNKDVELFQNKEQCQQHCLLKIKANNNLLQTQDFQKFYNQLICSIKQEIKSGFQNNQLNYIVQSLIILDLYQQQITVRLTQQQQEEINQFIDQQIPQQIQSYNDIVKKYVNSAQQEIDSIIKNQKFRLIDVNPRIVVDTACKETMQVIYQLDQEINKINQGRKEIILKKLQKLFNLSIKRQLSNSVEIIGEIDQTLERCQKMYELIQDNQIYQIQKTSFEKYASDLQITMGVGINNIQKSIGLASSGLSIVAFLGRRFLLQSALCTPFFGTVGLGLLSFNFDFLFNSTFYSPQLVEQNLNSWKEQLHNQIKSLGNEYIQSNVQILVSLQNLLSSIVS